MTFKTICISHSPFMGVVETDKEIEAAVNGRIRELADEVSQYDPELVVLVAPDHFNGFFYDLMPPFCVGVEATAIGDFGSAAGPIKVDGETAISFVEAMGESGFDVAVSYRMQVDHGFSQPLQELTGSLQRYPTLPIFINSVAPPRASCHRVREFGIALGKYLAGLDKRILMIGSGGLSHDPPVPNIQTAPPEVVENLISGRNPTPDARKAREDRTFMIGSQFAAGESELRDLNEEWDRKILDVFNSGKLEEVDGFTDDWITGEAGRAGHEIRTWIAVLAAQAASGSYNPEVLYQGIVNDWIVGMAVLRAD